MSYNDKMFCHEINPREFHSKEEFILYVKALFEVMVDKLNEQDIPLQAVDIFEIKAYIRMYNKKF